MTGETPFAQADLDVMRTIRAVVEGKVKYPSGSRMPKQCRGLVQSMLGSAMPRRLGNGQGGGADLKVRERGEQRHRGAQGRARGGGAAVD